MCCSGSLLTSVSFGSCTAGSDTTSVWHSSVWGGGTGSVSGIGSSDSAVCPVKQDDLITLINCLILFSYLITVSQRGMYVKLTEIRIRCGVARQ